MKKIYLLLALLTISNVALAQYGSSQKPYCSELINYAKKNYDSRDSPTVLMSSMLAKVERYKIDGASVVIAYIKKNDFDFNGTPYIFCDISDERWRAFKNEAIYGSWGESFHKYIRDYLCDCQ
ncbi:hypothetical protein SAMN05192588_2508 [Nonlabens sp. Hel1_33_55]|uniref:hypothetical protein n=1 Tax=Nonlabens sp. Hel1_33_55 TaxID=1336802 RepID=UPI000875E12A|nr:hypothetical protein [Nonlabens sp. Hel1_33_55]SCY36646.1 hypothetical protein SAMN05192588_2508 [Nonlabens sp. Hel1_33_55]